VASASGQRSVLTSGIRGTGNAGQLANKPMKLTAACDARCIRH